MAYRRRGRRRRPRRRRRRVRVSGFRTRAGTRM